MKGALSKVDTNNLIDQHHPLASITNGTWAAFQSQQKEGVWRKCAAQRQIYVQ